MLTDTLPLSKLNGSCKILCIIQIVRLIAYAAQCPVYILVTHRFGREVVCTTHFLADYHKSEDNVQNQEE